jgi:hypothetical protein
MGHLGIFITRIFLQFPTILIPYFRERQVYSTIIYKIILNFKIFKFFEKVCQNDTNGGEGLMQLT